MDQLDQLRDNSSMPMLCVDRPSPPAPRFLTLQRRASVASGFRSIAMRLVIHDETCFMEVLRSLRRSFFVLESYALITRGDKTNIVEFTAESNLAEKGVICVPDSHYLDVIENGEITLSFTDATGPVTASRRGGC